MDYENTSKPLTQRQLKAGENLKKIIANIFNLCAISIPIRKDYWFSFSLLAKAKEDKRLLCIAKEIEDVINSN